MINFWHGLLARDKQERGLLLRVNLESDSNILTRILDILIHSRGAKPILHPFVLGILIPGVLFPVLDL